MVGKSKCSRCSFVAARSTRRRTWWTRAALACVGVARFRATTQLLPVRAQRVLNCSKRVAPPADIYFGGWVRGTEDVSLAKRPRQQLAATTPEMARRGVQHEVEVRGSVGNKRLPHVDTMPPQQSCLTLPATLHAPLRLLQSPLTPLEKHWLHKSPGELTLSV